VRRPPEATGVPLGDCLVYLAQQLRGILLEESDDLVEELFVAAHVFECGAQVASGPGTVLGGWCFARLERRLP
jgi:hypothetical protein